jgi:DhnA family fructose-bisphosphate aldolase class Ia
MKDCRSYRLFVVIERYIINCLFLNQFSKKTHNPQPIKSGQLGAMLGAQIFKITNHKKTLESKKA